MTKIIVHTPGGRTVTMHPRTRSNDGLHVFLHRATTTLDAEEVSYKGFSIEKGSGTQAMWQTYFPGGSNKKLPASGSLSEAKRKIDEYLVSRDSAGALIGGGHRPEGKHARRTPIEDIMNGPNSGQSHNDNPAQLRATGRTLVQYCDTTNEVREWARGEHYTRAQEAFLVEGFKQQRKTDGLSENV